MKYHLVNQSRFIIFLVILVISIMAIMTVKADAPSKYITYTVKQDDTIYDIANRNYISRDIRREMYEIQKHNNLYGERFWLQPGQELAIPIKDNMRKVEK